MKENIKATIVASLYIGLAKGTPPGDDLTTTCNQ
jgi:hypothetical protein